MNRKVDLFIVNKPNNNIHIYIFININKPPTHVAFNGGCVSFVSNFWFDYRVLGPVSLHFAPKQFYQMSPLLLADNSCSPKHIPASPLRFPILEPENLIIKYTPNVFRLNKSVLFSRPIRNVTVRTMTSIRIHVYSVIGQTGMKASGYLTIWMIWTLTNSDITWGQESGNSYFKYHRTEDRREIGIVFSSYTYFELFFL